MVIKNKQYSIPKFNSLEEEDKYWQTHSPLLEEYKGKVQNKKQNRASFLSVRLTGEELSQLKEQAWHYGLGPSTYARQILIQATKTERNIVPVDLVFALCRYSLTGKITEKQKEKMFSELNDIYNSYLKMQDDIAKTMLKICPSNEKEDSELKQLEEKRIDR